MTERPESLDLTNPRSERVRSVRALAGRSARLRHGLFLVEGPQGAREAVRCAPERVRDVYLMPSAAARYPEIRDGARAAGVRTHVASPEVLDALSPDAQGVLAVVRIDAPSLESVLAARPRLVAVLAAVRDPGNAGTVIRTADAAGAGAVVLATTSVDVHNPKVVRATAGSLFHLPVITGLTVAEAVVGLRAAGLIVLAADGGGEHDLDALLDAVPTPGSRPPGRYATIRGSRAGRTFAGCDLSAPTAWLFGNEAHGLTADERELADATVRVPIHGKAESLNLATAAAICLYASARAQR